MRKLVINILLLIFIIPLTSCSFIELNNETDISDSINNITENLMEDAFKVVVHYYQYRPLPILLSEVSIGSGVLLIEDDEFYYVFTNRHVIEADLEYDKITISLIDYKDETIDESCTSIFYIDETADIAIIRFRKIIPYSLNVKLCEGEINSGDYCFAVGNPLGQRNAITVGKIYGLKSLTTDSENGVEFEYLVHSAKLQSGNSGGMLLNSKGELIGINTISINENDYGGAIPVTEIVRIMKKTKLISTGGDVDEI